MKNLAFNDDGTLATPTEAEVSAQFEAANREFNALFPDRRGGDPEAVDISPAEVEPADLDTLTGDPEELGANPEELAGDLDALDAVDPADLSPADFEDWLYS